MNNQPCVINLGMQNFSDLVQGEHFCTWQQNASRILAIVQASVRLSVCLSVILVICIKTVQARITKSSLWAAPQAMARIKKLSVETSRYRSAGRGRWKSVLLNNQIDLTAFRRRARFLHYIQPVLRAKAATAFSASQPSQFCQSVCLSVTRVDQSETVRARITKSSPQAAWKTLVSETMKLFHKFEGGHPERGR